MAKIQNRAILIAGEKRKVGTPVVTVVELDRLGKVSLCYGATQPTDADAGYALGCIFTLTTGNVVGGTVYINEGSSASADFNALGTGGLELTEVSTGTNVITAAESGTVFFLNSATEFVTTLPAASTSAGVHYKFIVTAAPVGASYTIVTNASENLIIGNQISIAGDAGDSGIADDTITFVDGQSVAGDYVELHCDGTNWFAYAISKIAAGMTFTQAS